MEFKNLIKMSNQSIIEWIHQNYKNYELVKRPSSIDNDIPKFIVELYLDGYETEEEMIEGAAEFIYENLNMSGSGVSIKLIEYKEYL